MSNVFSTESAGEAFLVDPPGGASGPGVLVLHSWWGLTDDVRDYCRSIAAEGYTVLAPDLLHGATPQSDLEAAAVLAEQAPDQLAGLVMSSAHTLRACSLDPNAEIAVIGFAMGGSLGLWLSTRLTTVVSGVVTYYGAQSIDFDEADARYLGHFGDADEIVSEEDRVTTEAFIRLGGSDTEWHLYEGCDHFFAEPGRRHDAEAAELAMGRTTAFLAEVLGSTPAETADA